MEENKGENILHIINISFAINYFFGEQFLYLKNIKKENNYFVACSESKELYDLSKKLGFTPFPVQISRTISPIKDLLAIIKIIKIIKRNKITKVVGHTPKGGMVAMIASFCLSIDERIYFRHGIIYETSRGIKRLLLKSIDKLSGSLATKVVCVSNSVKEISEKDNLNAKTKNIVLGIGTCNGIDTEKKFNPERFTTLFKQDFKKKYSITSNDFVVGYVGRIVKDKGIEELVAAWENFEKTRNNVKLLLVGPIEKRDAISEQTKHKIKNNKTIIYKDFVADTSPFFSIMDIFILPTYREGFPTVSLEASSMSIPVLITNATGCSESIINNVTGRFITHEISDIEKKIDYYYTDRAKIISEGKAGREFSKNNFEQTIVWNLINKQLGL